MVLARLQNVHGKMSGVGEINEAGSLPRQPRENQRRIQRSVGDQRWSSLPRQQSPLTQKKQISLGTRPRRIIRTSPYLDGGSFFALAPEIARRVHFSQLKSSYSVFCVSASRVPEFRNTPYSNFSSSSNGSEQCFESCLVYGLGGFLTIKSPCSRQEVRLVHLRP